MADNLLEVYLDQLNDRLTRIEEKIDSLSEFKTRTIVTARTTSVIVSAILGFISLVSSSVLAYVITTNLK